ncbi:hypothetical protein ACQZV8_00670 [Magnetococcales bacterium HHB-1]
MAKPGIIIILVDDLPSGEDLTTLGSTLSRLTALGECGRVLWNSHHRYPEEVNVIASLLAKEVQSSNDFDPPLGFLAAIGRQKIVRSSADYHALWARVVLTHWRRQRDKLHFVSPERTGQTVAEITQWVDALRATWLEEGWKIHQIDDEILISSDLEFSVRLLAPTRLEGVDMGKVLSDQTSMNIKQLLLSGQLLLARHPLNQQRTQSGQLAVNSPWIWGVGRGDTLSVCDFFLNHPFKLWTSDAVSAGWARLAGGDVGWLDKTEEDTVQDYLLEQIKNRSESVTLIHWQAPAILARHGLNPQREAWLKRWDKHFLNPLTQWMAKEKQRLVVAGGMVTDDRGLAVDDMSNWVMIDGDQLTKKQRFWHRQKWGQGLQWPIEEIRQKWLDR